MMSVTHAALSAAAVTAGLWSADPMVVGLSILASQLPDIDTTQSLTGRILWPVARWLETRFSHRSVTHSFAATAAIALVSGGLTYTFGWPWLYFGAVVLGYFVGWFADAFTKSGVEAFYPNPARLVIPGNPRARLATHSAGEYWVLSLAVLTTVAAVQLAGTGGLVETLSVALFQDTGTAVELFHKYGDTERLYAEVEGIHVHSAQAVSDTYEILAVKGSDLIGQSQASGVIHHIGRATKAQVRPRRVQVVRGGPVRIRSQSLILQEIAVTDWLAAVPPVGLISGFVILEDPEALQLTPRLGEYPTLKPWEERIVFSHAQAVEISAALGDHWILHGQVIIQERT